MCYIEKAEGEMLSSTKSLHLDRRKGLVF
jgi:hypothetical protein